MMKKKMMTLAVVSTHKLFWNLRLVLKHFKSSTGELFESIKKLFKLEFREMENNKTMYEKLLCSTLYSVAHHYY